MGIEQEEKKHYSLGRKIEIESQVHPSSLDAYPSRDEMGMKHLFVCFLAVAGLWEVGVKRQVEEKLNKTNLLVIPTKGRHGRPS
ncbi:uncharacterized protein ARB_01803 [Trichophyton benhamiae CBS 112371]|uniref:Uncharacterized protein n=1 Tax=Arthroderma benhamiae (strain ATCC MYA-4681 / CBS 112371) TaxID=663331 RepID=D4B032_ARTBC|nr:uncharacterized protein ARB_01803 [Trichophyton benhamiae CBS 112371]EFE31407.1 hypothetical protein ARB_01803 [Trichophyton benhamiae CBS 112371]